MFAFTGAPRYKYNIKNLGDEELFNLIYQYDHKEYVITTSIQVDDDDTEELKRIQDLGLQNNHPYSIKGIAKISRQNEDDVTLLCMRNPFGRC